MARKIKISKIIANVADNSYLAVFSNTLAGIALNTSNITEGANLFFSNARVQNYLTGSVGNIIPAANNYYDLGSTASRWKDLYLSGNTIILGGATISSSGESLTLPADTKIGGTTVVTVNNISQVSSGNLNTSNIAEGSNLYYTNTRVRAAVGTVAANAAGLSYVESTGVFSLADSGVTAATYGNANLIPQITVDRYGRITAVSNVAAIGAGSGGGGDVASVNGQTGTVVLTTANIAESGNLYYTDVRVWANVGANLGNLNSWTSSNSSNIGNINSWLRTTNSNIGNLNSWVTSHNTSTGIAEGTNLYFTNTRVRAAVGTAAANAKGLSYVESTGEFSLSDSGVTAANYGNASFIPQITVDRFGRITAISNVAAVSSSASASTSTNNNFATYSYTGNGVANTFVVQSGITIDSILVLENGIVQKPTSDYTVSGSNVVFTAAPASNVSVVIRVLTGGISTGKAIAMALVFG